MIQYVLVLQYVPYDTAAVVLSYRSATVALPETLGAGSARRELERERVPAAPTNPNRCTIDLSSPDQHALPYVAVSYHDIIKLAKLLA